MNVYYRTWQDTEGWNWRLEVVASETRWTGDTDPPLVYVELPEDSIVPIEMEYGYESYALGLPSAIAVRYKINVDTLKTVALEPLLFSLVTGNTERASVYEIENAGVSPYWFNTFFLSSDRGNSPFQYAEAVTALKDGTENRIEITKQFSTFEVDTICLIKTILETTPFAENWGNLTAVDDLGTSSYSTDGFMPSPIGENGGKSRVEFATNRNVKELHFATSTFNQATWTNPRYKTLENWIESLYVYCRKRFVYGARGRASAVATTSNGTGYTDRDMFKAVTFYKQKLTADLDGDTASSVAVASLYMMTRRTGTVGSTSGVIVEGSYGKRSESSPASRYDNVYDYLVDLAEGMGVKFHLWSFGTVATAGLGITVTKLLDPVYSEKTIDISKMHELNFTLGYKSLSKVRTSTHKRGSSDVTDHEARLAESRLGETYHIKKIPINTNGNYSEFGHWRSRMAIAQANLGEAYFSEVGYDDSLYYDDYHLNGVTEIHRPFRVSDSYRFDFGNSKTYTPVRTLIDVTNKGNKKRLDEALTLHQKVNSYGLQYGKALLDLFSSRKQTLIRGTLRASATTRDFMPSSIVGEMATLTDPTGKTDWIKNKETDAPIIDDKGVVLSSKYTFATREIELAILVSPKFT